MHSGFTKTCAISGRPHRSNHWAFVAKCFCSSNGDILAFAVVACFCSYWRCYSPARLFLIEIIVLFPINFKGWLVLLPNFQLQKLQVSVCISTTKKNEVQKSSKYENARIPKFGKIPTTISAKYQNDSFTIIHSSLGSSCMHIDDKKKRSPKKFKIPKIFEFQN